MEDIKDLRVKIDEIDKQLLALFEERMRVCDKVLTNLDVSKAKIS